VATEHGQSTFLSFNLVVALAGAIGARPQSKEMPPTPLALDGGYTACMLDLLKVQMDTPLEVTTDGKNIIISPQVHQKAEATLLLALERINLKHAAVLSRLGK